MTLDKTIKLMQSDDYKERFLAEYYQLKIRHEKLNDMLEKYKNHELDFVPTCPYEVLLAQSMYMESYLEVLEHRAKLEGIEIEEEE